MKTRTSIRSLALEAGVSTATISRVFNNKDLEKVSAEVRKRVKAIIKKHGYSPSIHAKGLVCGKSSLLGVQLLSLADPIANVEMINALEKSAAAKKYNIILGLSNWNRRRETESINIMLEKGVDGIIWQPVKNPNQSLLKKISNSKCPLAWLNKDCGQGIPGAFNDEVKSGKMAFEFLLIKGCKNPVFIGFADDPHTQKRWLGWTEASRKWKINCCNKIFLKNYLTDNTKIGFKTIKQICSDKMRKIDGAFLSGSALAQGAYIARQELKMTCDEFPIIGHNMIPVGRNYFPIPSICPEGNKIGEAAFNLMENLWQGNPAASIYFSPLLKENTFV